MKLFKIIDSDEIKYIDLEKVAKIKIRKYIDGEKNLFEIRFYIFQNYESIAHTDLSEEEFETLSKILEKNVIYPVEENKKSSFKPTKADFGL